MQQWTFDLTRLNVTITLGQWIYYLHLPIKMEDDDDTVDTMMGVSPERKKLQLTDQLYFMLAITDKIIETGRDSSRKSIKWFDIRKK